MMGVLKKKQVDTLIINTASMNKAIDCPVKMGKYQAEFKKHPNIRTKGVSISKTRTITKC